MSTTSAIGVVSGFVRLAASRDDRPLSRRLRALVLTVGLVVGIGLLGELGTRAGRGIDVAVSAADALPFLVDDDVELVVVDDPPRAVADGDVDAAVVVDERGVLRVLERADDDISGAARDRLLATIAVADRAPQTPVARRLVEPDSPASTIGVTRSVLLGLAILLSTVLTETSHPLTAGAGSRALEPLLVLPVARGRLVAGTVLGLVPTLSRALGVVAVTLVGVALLPLPDLGLPAERLPGTAVGMTFGLLGIVPVAAAVGGLLAIGSAGRARGLVESAVTLPFVLGGVLAASDVVDPSPISGWLPVMANVGVVGRGMTGTLGALDVIASLVAAVVGVVAVWALTLRQLTGDAPGR